MVILQKRSTRKVSGSKYKAYRKKRICEKGNLPRYTKLGKKRVITFRERGGSIKPCLLSCDKANIYDPKTKQSKVISIKTIVENPANRHFIRRNILTKGAIIDTELGRAKVLNRPGQEGSVNAVLV